MWNKDALPDLAAFASNIFDETFNVEDIITSERRKCQIEEGMKKYTLEEYQDFKTHVLAMKDEVKAGAWLYERLAKDERIVTILTGKSQRHGNPQQYL